MLALTPQPSLVQMLEGACVLSDSAAVTAGPGAEAPARFAASELSRSMGLRLALRASGKTVVHFGLDSKAGALGDEGYRLRVAPHDVSVVAHAAAGLLRAAQTLRQLALLAGPAQPRALPCCEIEDHPRFAWRGSLLDAGRHFWTVDDTLRYIDLLALYRMNVLHWHLTEDQGWRIEIRKYPRLTEVGAWRREEDGSRYGGFYTQDEIRRVVAYAAERGVTVVPEIEMPGHSVAALASYPELSCTGGPFAVRNRWGVSEDVYCPGNEKVFAFLQDVLTEVMELFPSRWIHVGGNECPKTRWKTCPRCRERIRSEGLRDEHELQKYLINRIDAFLVKHGRVLVGWDEILESGAAGVGHAVEVTFAEGDARTTLSRSAVVQSWRGTQGGIAAARSGHDVVMSPNQHCYLDYDVAHVSTRAMYGFEPVPADLTPEQAQHVLGLEGAVWTESIAERDRWDYQAFPRLCALAEAAWTDPALRSWDGFRARLAAQAPLLQSLGVRYWQDPDVWPASGGA